MLRSIAKSAWTRSARLRVRLPSSRTTRPNAAGCARSRLRPRSPTAIADGKADVAIDCEERMDEIGEIARTLTVFKNNSAERRRMREEQTAAAIADRDRRRQSRCCDRLRRAHGRDRRDCAYAYRLQEQLGRTPPDARGADCGRDRRPRSPTAKPMLRSIAKSAWTRSARL